MFRSEVFTLDACSKTLLVRGQKVELPPKTVELLAVLAAREGRVVSKAELMDTLWPEGFVEESNLTQHVYRLRRAFRKYGAPDLIETHSRRGYRFVPSSGTPTVLPARARSRMGALAAAFALLCVLSSAPWRVQTLHAALPAAAAQDYAMGRYFWNLRSISGMSRSVGYFQKTIREAPGQAAGYAGLADAYTELADFEQPCAACSAWRRKAEVAASRALHVEPSSPEALTSLGMIARVFRHDDALAEREFRRAIAIDPRNAIAHQWYGDMLVARGSLLESRRQLMIAASLQPISTATYAWLARACFYDRRYDEAARYAAQALALEPTRLETTVLLGRIELARHHYASALRAFRREAQLGNPIDAAVWRTVVYGAMGKAWSGSAQLTKIAPAADEQLYASRDLVIAYRLVGDTGAAEQQLRHTRFENRLARELFARDVASARP